MKKIFILIFIIFISSNIFALDLVGTGYGKTETEAKKEALADLSTLVSVQVKSKFLSKTTAVDENQKKEIKKLITTNTDIPILGVTYDLLPAQAEIMAEAYLKENNVNKLYKEALSNTLRNINVSIKLLKTEKSDSEKYRLYTNLLTDIDKYLKYKAVAILIGIKDVKQLPITKSEILSKISHLEKSVNSIELASKILTKDINQKNIYVYAPTTSNSNEITPFAAAIKDRMTQYIASVQSPQIAKYYLKGSYIINKNSIDLVYQLISQNGETLSTKVVNLKNNAYKNYRIKPETINFDNLLHQGVVLSKDLRVQLATNKGSSNLIFKNKQTIEVLIKMNRAGYYYIIGHVNKKGEKYSYILEINEGQGDRKFIQRLSADDVNRWISLGEFEVVPPFGVENIQIIASNKDLINKVPPTKYDKNSGLYILSSSPKKAVIKTRALLKKKSKKTLIAEDVLTFTTMK